MQSVSSFYMKWILTNDQTVKAQQIKLLWEKTKTEDLHFQLDKLKFFSQKKDEILAMDCFR